MGLDIRLPMGAFFTLIGAMLAIWGLVADRAIYERSLGMNVNLVWGLVTLAFGLVLLYLSRRGTGASLAAPGSSGGPWSTARSTPTSSTPAPWPRSCCGCRARTSTRCARRWPTPGWR